MSKQRQEDDGLLLGRNPVREALQRAPRRIEKVLLQQGGADLSEIRRLAEHAGVQLQYVPAGRLNQLARGLNHQGVAALTSPVAYVEVHEMLEDIAPVREAVAARKPRVLVLDGIQDPFNFGAILRTAVAAGTAGVIIPGRDMAPLNAAAMKASAGTAGRIPIARVADLSETIYQLKERGYWVAGASPSGDVSVWEMDWNRPVVIIIGSEGGGIRRRVLEACDYSVRIPLSGPSESLNASVAAGILLFAAAREENA
jgi:23S rRNA (guanosine2251-2'-O)-methyltransferase